MQPKLPFTQFAQAAPLFTLSEARKRYGKDNHTRSGLNMLHRLKQQDRVHQLTKGVHVGDLTAVPLNRYRVPTALRDDAVLALHSALEWHGVNQVFQTVYYFSARAERRDLRKCDLSPRRASSRSRPGASGTIPNTVNS